MCYGVELEAKFVDVAVQRFRSYVSEHPECKYTDVYVLRDGQKLTLEEVLVEMGGQDE